jgi:hypothetical protein
VLLTVIVLIRALLYLLGFDNGRCDALFEGHALVERVNELPIALNVLHHFSNNVRDVLSAVSLHVSRTDHHLGGKAPHLILIVLQFVLNAIAELLHVINLALRLLVLYLKLLRYKIDPQVLDGAHNFLALINFLTDSELLTLDVFHDLKDLGVHFYRAHQLGKRVLYNLLLVCKALFLNRGLATPLL